jgi:Domain of unknown function (DUF4340)
MSRQRFISLVLAAVIALAGALYLSTQRNLPRDVQGAVFLPYLASEMAGVSELSIRKGGAEPSVTLQRRADKWSVKERADYPADVSKLRKLLLDLNDAKIVEEKTANPASFSIIGVEDPSTPGASGTEINLVAKDGPHRVIIGKSAGEGVFARRGAENQSYIVEPAISVESEPRFWIDGHLLDVAADTIQSIAIKPASASAYTIRRNGPSDGHFVLDGTPSGRVAADPASLAPSPTTYSALAADDVMQASGVDFGKPTVATLTTVDGNVITLTGALNGDKHWIQISATRDAALAAKSRGRAYEISAYRYDAIFRPLEQLLVPKEPPPGAKKSVPGPLPLASPTHRLAPSPRS